MKWVRVGQREVERINPRAKFFHTRSIDYFVNLICFRGIRFSQSIVNLPASLLEDHSYAITLITVSLQLGYHSTTLSNSFFNLEFANFHLFPSIRISWPIVKSPVLFLSCLSSPPTVHMPNMNIAISDPFLSIRFLCPLVDLPIFF